jgi:hypothetical protein
MREMLSIVLVMASSLNEYRCKHVPKIELVQRVLLKISSYLKNGDCTCSI